MDTSTPIIDSLGLTEAAIAALRTNGFVHCEARGAHTRYRLRFRIERRQIVVELGGDASRADAVRQELAVLQAAIRARRRAARLAKEIRKQLRVAKTLLVPHAESAGLRFHGRQLRRPRTTSPNERKDT